MERAGAPEGDRMERWTFGVEPLAQTTRAATLLRRITSLVLALEEESPEVAALLTELQRADRMLQREVPTDPRPRVGAASSSDGRVYLDHARDIGAFNPCFPEYTIEVEGTSARGTVEFPIAYEGPPGIVHGGFLAVLFDCVVQHHNCDVGVAGKTTSLTLRYRRPTPVLTPLSFTLERRVVGERIYSSGALMLGDKMLCEAEAEAIAGNRSNLPEVSPRRTAD
jgi:hypothetical protein